MKYKLLSDDTIIRDDGAAIPVADDNADYIDYKAWTLAGNAPAPYVAPAPTITQVRAEAQRRIIAVTGARDLMGCLVKQLNANMRASELNDKRVSGGTLTAAEEAEAAALRGLADKIKAIRAASNIFEPSPPADYAANNRWPA